MISQHNKHAWRNPWFLGILALMAVVLGVNGIFIWLATQNRPALVDRAYSARDGKSDAAALHDIEMQRSLAWQTTIRQPQDIAVNVPAAYTISVADRGGAPVSGTMEVTAYRAADAGQDFTTAFGETSPGNYHGQISFPLKGYWELRIRTRRGDEDFEVRTGRFMVAETPSREKPSATQRTGIAE